MTTNNASPKGKMNCHGASRKAPHFAVSSARAERIRVLNPTERERRVLRAPAPTDAPQRPIRWPGRGRPLVDFGIGGDTRTNQMANATT